ncbi:MAG: hypothetical protein FWG73_09010 [Planctomycetaceae bacterium]|nr:hypothetical protein [Planctomycetaceae bacterium]
MPKLNNRPPKYSKIDKYTVVYYGGKSHYLGRYGSDESKIAYARLLAEIQASPTGVPVPKEEQHVTVREISLTMRRQTPTQQNTLTIEPSSWISSTDSTEIIPP